MDVPDGRKVFKESFNVKRLDGVFFDKIYAVTANYNKTLLCVLPFATWMALMGLLPTFDMFVVSDAMSLAMMYALRTVATAAVGVACLWAAKRSDGAWPAQSGACSPSDLLAGTAVGLAVCALWTLPECLEAYRTWCVTPIGTDMPEPIGSVSPYSPESCGWPLTLTKLVGSAFVIAPVEEVFFRHFLYKRLVRRDFWNVPLRHFDASAFCWTVLIFTLEHDRPLAAATAGAAYGLLAIYRGLPAAIVAHVVTNFALGLHVVVNGAWRFW